MYTLHEVVGKITFEPEVFETEEEATQELLDRWAEAKDEAVLFHEIRAEESERVNRPIDPSAAEAKRMFFANFTIKKDGVLLPDLINEIAGQKEDAPLLDHQKIIKNILKVEVLENVILGDVWVSIDSDDNRYKKDGIFVHIESKELDNGEYSDEIFEVSGYRNMLSKDGKNMESDYTEAVFDFETSAADILSISKNMDLDIAAANSDTMFWNHDYRHSMRGVFPPIATEIIKEMFIARDLDPEGVSDAHEAIINEVMGYGVQNPMNELDIEALEFKNAPLHLQKRLSENGLENVDEFFSEDLAGQITEKMNFNLSVIDQDFICADVDRMTKEDRTAAVEKIGQIDIEKTGVLFDVQTLQ